MDEEVGVRRDLQTPHSIMLQHPPESRLITAVKGLGLGS